MCGSSGQEGGQDVREQQLSRLRADRERKAIEEIRQAALTVQAQGAVVQLAQQRARSWQERAREEEEKQSKGIGSLAATTEAKVEFLKAQRQVVKEMTNLQRAWVKLRQTQGILPLDCFPEALPTHVSGPSGVPPPPPGKILITLEPRAPAAGGDAAETDVGKEMLPAPQNVPPRLGP
jgi:outer membrane protein TolC